MSKSLDTPRAARWFEPLAGSHTYCVMKAMRLLYRHLPDTADQDVRRFVEGCLERHPPELRIQRQIALHEAGHYLAFEAEGMIAGSAEIHGSAGGHDGWGGTAKAFERPFYDGEPYGPGDLLSEARSALAGPWSEVALGGGDLYGSISEIIEAVFLGVRAAEMLGRNPNQVLTDILVGAAAIVDTYRDEIEEVATRLMSRRRIGRNKSLERLLARVQEVPVESLPKPNKSRTEEVARLIGNAVPGINELIMRVTTPELAA